MSGPPAQGYKMSGEGHIGGGPDGSTGGNVTGMIPGGGTRQAQAQDATGPPQEIAGTLPNDFTLANTKAEVKGGDHEPVYSHEIDQPENQPSKQAQRNEGTRPINGPAQ